MINNDLINDCIEYVARDFADAMHECGFENFAEMSACYSWTTSDIKEETIYTIKEFNYKKTEKIPAWVYLDDNGTTILDDYDGEMSYRKFIARVKKRANEIIKKGDFA